MPHLSGRDGEAPAGIRVVMITGDAVLTAAEVARKVGIIQVEAENTLELVKDGKEWRAMR